MPVLQEQHANQNEHQHCVKEDQHTGIRCSVQNACYHDTDHQKPFVNMRLRLPCLPVCGAAL